MKYQCIKVKTVQAEIRQMQSKVRYWVYFNPAELVCLLQIFKSMQLVEFLLIYEGYVGHDAGT